jgi:hypothetical protein
MGIFLAAEFELHEEKNTFLKMDFRWLIIELGAYLLAWRVDTKTASISQKQHHCRCCLRRQECEC